MFSRDMNTAEYVINKKKEQMPLANAPLFMFGYLFSKRKKFVTVASSFALFSMH